MDCIAGPCEAVPSPIFAENRMARSAATLRRRTKAIDNVLAGGREWNILKAFFEASKLVRVEEYTSYCFVLITHEIHAISRENVVDEWLREISLNRLLKSPIFERQISQYG